MTIQEAVGLLASVIDRPLRVKYLPAPVALVGGAVVGAAFRLVGRTGAGMPGDGPDSRPRPCLRRLVRAARELGLSYTPATETLTRLISCRARAYP